MKTRKIILFILAFTVLTLIMIRCTFVNPLDDFQVIMNAPQMSTIITVQFQDAATGKAIMNQAVTVTVIGKDADKIADFAFQPEVHYSAVAGITSFSLIEDVNPTPQEPIEITLIIRSDGYIPTSFPIHIDKHSTYPFIIKLSNIENPPKGVSLKKVQQGSCNQSGIVTEGFAFETETNADLPTKLSLNLEAGTRILGKNGNPLSGDLNIVAGYFSPMDQEALEVFPGGMNATVTTLDGETEDAIFISAGFVELQITDTHGNQAATLENGGMDIDIEVSPDMVNPETGEPIRAGETISAWSYDSDTGEWTEEGVISFSEPNEDGYLVGSFSVTHFSSYNLDWDMNGCSFYVAFRNWNETPVSLTLTRSGRASMSRTLFDPVNVLYLVPDDERLHFVFKQRGHIVIDTFIVTPTSPDEWTPVDTLWFTLAETSDNPDLWVDPATGILNGGGDQTVDFIANLECYNEGENNPYMTFRPTLPVYVLPPSSDIWYYAGVMIDGQFQFTTMKTDDTYVFQFNHQQVDPAFVTVNSGTLSFQTITYDLRLSREFCDGTGVSENPLLYGSFDLQQRFINGSQTNFIPLRYDFDPGGYGMWFLDNDSGGIAWYTGGNNMAIVQMPVKTMVGTYTLVYNDFIFTYTDTKNRQIVEHFIRIP